MPPGGRAIFVPADGNCVAHAALASAALASAALGCDGPEELMRSALDFLEKNVEQIKPGISISGQETVQELLQTARRNPSAVFRQDGLESLADLMPVGVSGALNRRVYVYMPQREGGGFHDVTPSWIRMHDDREPLRILYNGKDHYYAYGTTNTTIYCQCHPVAIVSLRVLFCA